MYIEEALTAAYHRVCPPPTASTDPLVPQQLCVALLEVLPIHGAALSVFGPAGLPVLIGASCPDTDHFARMEFTCGQGPTIDAYLSRDVVSAPHPEGSARWPMLAEQTNAATPFRSVLAFRLPGAMSATLTLFFRAEDPPDLPIADLQALGSRITTTLLDALPHESTTKKPTGAPPWLVGPTVLTSQKVMVAAGIISALTPLDVDDALAVLRARAWASHRTADQLATLLLDETVTSDPTAVFEREGLLSSSSSHYSPGAPAPRRPPPASSDKLPAATESTWPPTVIGISMSSLMANLSPADKVELHAAQLQADRAAQDQDQAVQQARAVRYCADTEEMALLTEAERNYQCARRRLEAIWERHRG